MLRLLVTTLSLLQLKPAVPTEPITAILDAFRTYQIVALGDGAHDELEAHLFRLALIRDRRFPLLVNDIAVECGNARYQSVMDRYVLGDGVHREVLIPAWRDTTTTGTLCDRPIFEEFFRAVRDVNETLPSNRKLRVLLGDPPIDWTQINQASDFRTLNRDAHLDALIRREVLAKGRRALISYGGLHLLRRPLLGQSLIGQLERTPGVRVLSVWTATANQVAFAQPSAASWRTPAFAYVAGTELGAAELPYFYPRRVAEQVDAVLNLGRFTPVALPPELCADHSYVTLRLRRMDMTGEGDRLRRYCASVGVKVPN